MHFCGSISAVMMENIMMFDMHTYVLLALNIDVHICFYGAFAFLENLHCIYWKSINQIRRKKRHDVAMEKLNEMFGYQTEIVFRWS